MTKKRKAKSTSSASTPFSESTYFLTAWFIEAAKASLDRSGANEDVDSPHIADRISTVFFAAAALDSCINRVGEELLDGTGPLPVVDREGVFDSTLKNIARGPWKQKLSLYSLLWSSSNRWVMAEDIAVLQKVTNLMGLRNRLIHAPPEKEEHAGDRNSAGVHMYRKTLVPFTRGPSPDLPKDLLAQLQIQDLREYITCVEELVGRIQSLSDLWPHGQHAPTYRSHVRRLNSEGSDIWRDAQSGLSHQVRWCQLTNRYVMHYFASDGMGADTPDESTRECRNGPSCGRVDQCSWLQIRPPKRRPTGQ